MYGTTISPSSATLAGSAGAGALASTGIELFWLVFTALALLMIGIILMRLRPKGEY
jgi:hypothetical protein